MPAEHVLLPFLWRRQLNLMRVLLAIAALFAYSYWRVFLFPLLPVLFCVYLLASISVLYSKQAEQLSYTDVGLMADTFFFLLVAAHPAPQVLWLIFTYYFYILLVAALLYDWRKIIYVVVCCSIYFLLVRPAQLLALWPIVLLSGVLACMLALQKRALQERLSAAFRRAVLSRSEAEMARVLERQRIAADFHDGPLQSFISFQMRLEIVRKLMGRDINSARDELVQLQELCKFQVAELRSFVRSMRPQDTDNAQLAALVRQILRTFENDSAISVTLQDQNLTSPPDSGSSLEILQIIREALNNIQKHSRASRVTVTLANVEQKLEINLEDDGTGFPFGGVYSLEELDLLGLGPVAIKRRVRGLGGELTIDSRPGRGASLRIRLPI